MQRLQAACRTAGIEVMYAVIESLTKDGRDRSLDYKITGFNVPRGSWDAKVIDAIAPGEDEIVIPKTSSSVFISTNIDYVLRNLGVRYLMISGVVTDQCVESAVRDACDLGYLVTLATDACATYSQERHDNTLGAIKGYCRQRTTDQLVAEIAGLGVSGRQGRGFLLDRVVEGDGRERLRIRHDVEQRDRIAGPGTVERGADLAGLFDTKSLAAAGPRDRGVIDGGEVADVGMVAEQQVLGMRLIAEDLVVQHHQHEAEAEPPRGLQLGPDMAEAAVADDADRPAVGAGDARADREGQAPAQAGHARAASGSACPGGASAGS